MDGNVAQWVGIGILATGQLSGLLIFLVKWNRVSMGDTAEDAAEETSVKENLKYIKREIGSTDHGLSALKNEITNIQRNCATVSTGLSVKSDEHERRITNLEGKKRS